MTLIASPFTFEHSRIHHGLHQGSRPQPDTNLATQGFSVIAFCAHEHQPPASAFPTLSVLRVPLIEDSFLDDDAAAADAAAGLLAQHVMAGQNVLVTCLFGRNRSGLVSALTLHHLFGWSGKRCLDWVRRMRPQSLMNGRMNAYLLTKEGTP